MGLVSSWLVVMSSCNCCGHNDGRDLHIVGEAQPTALDVLVDGATPLNNWLSGLMATVASTVVGGAGLMPGAGATLWEV